ncbi:hypothetical protein ACFW9I_03370 [[Kitasatospora] papulosa]|uniref:hypothetical protein n=1 Tax=[Kitasatospora] papulosa TaxID=1464011 RepID=UPI0036CD94EA
MSARRPRRFTPLEEAVQGIETAITPLKGDQRAGADMALTYLRTLTTPDTTVPRDLRPGADAARRMIRDRQTAEDPHDSPLHHGYALSRDLPRVAEEDPARCLDVHPFTPRDGWRLTCGSCDHAEGAPCHHRGGAS